MPVSVVEPPASPPAVSSSSATSPPPAYDWTKDAIFQPLRFPKVRKGPDGKLIVTPGAGLEVKNRIFRSSISGQFDHYNGTGSDVRIRWEEKFARGGVGAIISSFVPVRLDGRILPRYAMIHKDSTIMFWDALARRVEKAGQEHSADGKECKYLTQLSHGGRQRDIPGVENFMSPGLSSTSKPDSFHGLLCRAMTITEIEGIIEAFAKAAGRAKAAGVHGVELHASHGYLFTQFLSSAINDRTDKYGGSVENRARFLVDVITAIRGEVGWDYHVQAKINILDRNRAYWPLEWKDGNTVNEARQIFAWAENAGLNGLHVSAGSTFPHPYIPSGGFPLDEGTWWYGGMSGSGTRAFQNLVLFRFPWMRWIFRLAWNRVKKELPIEGVSAALCKFVKQDSIARAEERRKEGREELLPIVSEGALRHIPVLNTGGYQRHDLIHGYLTDGTLDGVAIARPLIANNDLVDRYLRHGQTPPEDQACSFCNRCLLNALANPLACYDQRRFASREDMIETAMSVFPDHYEPSCPDPHH